MPNDTPAPITDDEIDRTALDIMRWGYRDTARRILEYKQELRALRANVGEPVTANELKQLLLPYTEKSSWSAQWIAEHICKDFAGRRISHE